MAWHEISVNMKLHTGNILRDRFKNIKETYANNLRKVKKSMKSGASASSVYKPAWHLYEYLDYLEPTCRQADSDSNIPVPELPQEDENSYESYDNNDNADATSDCTVKYVKDPNTGIYVLVENDHSNSVPGTSTFTDEPSTSNSHLHQSLNTPKAPKKRGREENNGSNEESFFTKKGDSKRKGTEVLQNALKALENIAAQPIPAMPVFPVAEDSVSEFCKFLDKRLNLLSPADRKKAEDKLLTIMIAEGF